MLTRKGLLDLTWGGFVALLVVLSWAQDAVGDDGDHPAQDLVRATTTEIFSTIEKDPSYRQDLPRLYALVERVIVPHLDLDRMAMRVLGKYWRAADERQRDAFRAEFKAMLMRTYGTALVSYVGQEVKFLPTRVKRPDDATVRTAVATGGPNPTPVDYQMMNEDGHWKVYDVAIEGVSLVITYRASFGEEIRANGLDALIARLRAKNLEESR